MSVETLSRQEDIGKPTEWRWTLARGHVDVTNQMDQMGFLGRGDREELGTEPWTCMPTFRSWQEAEDGQ